MWIDKEGAVNHEQQIKTSSVYKSHDKLFPTIVYWKEK